MNRNKVNLAVDLPACIAMAGLAATGIVLYYRLPAGSGGNTMFGLTRHEWGDIHFWIAVVLLVLVSLHIVLHWNWIACAFGATFGGENRAKRGAGDGPGGTAMLVLLGLLLAGLVAVSLAAPVTEGTGGGGHGGGKGNRHRGGRYLAPDGEAGVVHRTGRAFPEREGDGGGRREIEPESGPRGGRPAGD